MSESKDIPQVVAEEQEDYIWVPVSTANRSITVSFPNNESWTMGATSQCMRITPSSCRPQSSSYIPRQTVVFVPQKRKCETDGVSSRPAKKFLTEERMTLQLKNMHISNKYVSGQGGAMVVEPEVEREKLPTLTLSKEVQSLPTLNPILPESIISNLNRPSRALILWTPPAGDIGNQLRSHLDSSKPSSDDRDNLNNNTSTPDLNTMATPPQLVAADKRKDDAMDI